MKHRILPIFLAASISAAVLLSADITPQQKYIDTYGGIAVSEMHRSGVPASITLAQGLLESGCGLSKLAVEGNNHFGIKCHSDWKGRTMKADDDRKGECFRVYDDAGESFRDHSDFLRYRSRYQSLFELNPTDYKAWAYGLKKAGYATDSAYPEKLIRIIEENGLDRFDVMVVADSVIIAETGEKVPVPSLPPTPRQLEEFSFSFESNVYMLNGVRFVYAQSGESYASIAEREDMFPEELMRYNDRTSAEPLLQGEVVYLSPKKREAVKGMDKYIVDEEGVTLWDIAQKYAVKLSSIMRMNAYGPDVVLREGDTVLLRRPGKEKAPKEPRQRNVSPKE